MRNIILFLVLVLIACNSEQALKKTIAGNWTITEAFRDEVQTTMLDGAYMRFDLNEVKTNLFGSEATSAYTISEASIKQLNNPTIEYKILEKSATRLILGTNYDGFEFRFIFGKTE